MIDDILDRHAGLLGADEQGYRHHVYRVANLCAAQTARDADVLERIGIAAAFHDLGIWTHRTFDYLAPSIGLAQAYLDAHGRTGWSAEVSAMIAGHHQITPIRGETSALVEAFRRADWADVTRGLRAGRLGRDLVRQLYRRWPDAGFHRMLLRQAVRRAATHPRSPLPMLRW